MRPRAAAWRYVRQAASKEKPRVLAYFVGYQHDITRQVEAEQALLQASSLSDLTP